ncbi:MAG: hypothetical protein HY819_23200 [Acidobacteria bacterium]|nr:hypothetical protein [Acidobacteriota bacterium]
MINEDLKKNLEFIVEQQALLASRIEQLTENVFALKDIAVANANSLERLTSLLERMVNIQEKTDNNVGFLSKFQERTNNQVIEIVHAHAQTEEKLNIFISMFEKYISQIQDSSTSTQ